MVRLEEFTPFITAATSASSAIIKKYFRQNMEVELKGDSSPVTIADKKAEEEIRALIQREFPEHGIMGEEFDDYKSDAEYCWLIDPIDGTKSFLAGTPLFGTLIALLRNREPILGAIHLPILDQLFIGNNESARLNGEAIGVAPPRPLSDAFLLTTDHLNIAKYRTAAGFDELTRQVRLYRTWGDCYGYTLLSAGYVDIMIDPKLSPWDSMALIPVLKGAGGQVSDYYGKEVTIESDSMIATTGPELQMQVVKLLNAEE